MLCRNRRIIFSILFFLPIFMQSANHACAQTENGIQGNLGRTSATSKQVASQYLNSSRNVQYGQWSQTTKPIAVGWAEYFESDTPSWKFLHRENGATVISQNRTGQSFYQGAKAEKLQFSFPQQQSCLVLGHTVDFPMLIEDLQASIYVRSDSPNIILGAQIVLPNSIHPETGRPITFLVLGSRYSGSGDWEQLGFWDKNGKSNLFSESTRIGNLLRQDFSQNLDMRDRYVRQIILFCESASTTASQTRLETDSLEMIGYAATRPELLARFEWNRATGTNDPLHVFDPINYSGFKLQAASQCVFLQAYSSESSVGYTDWQSSIKETKPGPLVASSTATRQRALFDDRNEVRVALTNTRNSNGSSPASTINVQLQDTVLTLNDRPIGVRAIEYQGEPLAFLRKLEFNTVWVNGRPSPELLQEAIDAGVWLICAPPEPSEIEAAQPYSSTSTQQDRLQRLPQIGSIYDNVLVWNIGDECTNPDHQSNAQRIALLKNADRIRRRPILCTARSGVREYSRIVDILMMERQPIFSSLDLVDLERWLATYPSLARPDTPFWATIQTDADSKLAEQWALFGGNPLDVAPMTHEQLKIQIYRALAVGTHGFIFTSNTPLTGNDPATEYRRTSLELINWELQLIEQWFAAGRGRSNLVSSSLKRRMSSAVLQSDRTRLLVPIWRERDSQFAVGAVVEGPLHYIVSGIPETYDAYLLTPGRLQPLNAERVAGGMRVDLDEANLNTLVYFGESDDIYAQIEARSKEIGPQAAYLSCRLAELQLASTKKILSHLKQVKDAKGIPEHTIDKLPLISLTEQESMLNETQEWIEVAKRFVKQNPPAYAMAYIQAEKATRGLRATARDLLREATRHDLNPCMTPVSVSFATLPLYLSAYRRTAGARLEPVNRLPAGDMESNTFWQQSGWNSHLHRVEGIASPVLEITSHAKRSGQLGLRMRVQASSPEEKPAQLEAAPLFFFSPQIPVRMGEMICVNGWVRIPQPLESSIDGLMIFDSLGGESQAVRFRETRGVWKEFAFYRYVPADCNYFVCFSLHGLGEVHLDDIRISGVQFDVPAPQQAAPQPGPPSTWQRFNPFNYLPPLPNWGQQ